MSVPGGGAVSGSEGLGNQGPTVNTQARVSAVDFPEFVDLFTESVSLSVVTVCQIPGIRMTKSSEIRAHAGASQVWPGGRNCEVVLT